MPLNLNISPSLAESLLAFHTLFLSLSRFLGILLALFFICCFNQIYLLALTESDFLFLTFGISFLKHAPLPLRFLTFCPPLFLAFLSTSLSYSPLSSPPPTLFISLPRPRSPTFPYLSAPSLYLASFYLASPILPYFSLSSCLLSRALPSQSFHFSLSSPFLLSLLSLLRFLPFSRFPFSLPRLAAYIFSSLAVSSPTELLTLVPPLSLSSLARSLLPPLSLSPPGALHTQSLTGWRISAARKIPLHVGRHYRKHAAGFP